MSWCEPSLNKTTLNVYWSGRVRSTREGALPWTATYGGRCRSHEESSLPQHCLGGALYVRQIPRTRQENCNACDVQQVRSPTCNVMLVSYQSTFMVLYFSFRVYRISALCLCAVVGHYLYEQDLCVLQLRGFVWQVLRATWGGLQQQWVQWQPCQRGKN